MISSSEKFLVRYYSGGILKECSISQYEDFLKAKDREAISQIIYWRLYGRYIKPFEFNDRTYKKEFKNGFAMMASCCLLIETYIGFKKERSLLLNKDETDFHSSKHFAYFFTEESEFSLLNDVSLNINGHWILGKNKPGLINDFYNNVRCGILHYGETKNGWTINRNNDDKYIDINNKTINAFSFMNRLKRVIKKYTDDLLEKDWDSAEWETARKKMENVIGNCSEIIVETTN